MRGLIGCTARGTVSGLARRAGLAVNYCLIILVLLLIASFVHLLLASFDDSSWLSHTSLRALEAIVLALLACWLVMFGSDYHATGACSVAPALRKALLIVLRPMLIVVALLSSPVALLSMGVATVAPVALGRLALEPPQPTRLEIAERLVDGKSEIVPTAPVSEFYMQFWAFLVSVPLAALALTALGIAVAFAKRWIRWTCWFLKVAADVACFMGDREYQERIIKSVVTSFQQVEVSPGDRIVIVGHSLGSVIAVMAYVRTQALWPQNVNTTLITMASPLRRLLWRFFRANVPAPDVTARALRRRNPRFAWVNIYRPNDPIGNGLFCCPSESAIDQCTLQRELHGVAAHTGYWDDPKVCGIAAAAISQVYGVRDTARSEQTDKDMCLERTDWNDVESSIAVCAKIGRSPLFQAAVHSTLSLVIVLAVGTGLFGQFSLPLNREMRLREEGVHVNGMLYRYELYLPQRPESGDHAPKFNYIVVFQMPGSEEGHAYPVAWGSMGLSEGDLFAATTEPARVRKPGHWWDDSAKKGTVSVRVAKTDPSVFDFPEIGKSTFTWVTMRCIEVGLVAVQK